MISLKVPFHFPLPCVYSFYITLIENWKKKNYQNIQLFFSFSEFFLKKFIRQQNPLKSGEKKSIKKKEKTLLTIIDLCATTPTKLTDLCTTVPIKLIDYNYDYECIIDSG